MRSIKFDVTGCRDTPARAPGEFVASESVFAPAPTGARREAIPPTPSRANRFVAGPSGQCPAFINTIMKNQTKNGAHAQRMRCIELLKRIAAARIAAQAAQKVVINNPQQILCDGALAQDIKQELVWRGKPFKIVGQIGPDDPHGFPLGDYVLEIELADAAFFKMHGDRVRLIQ
ncbi:hypothetical protein M2323_003567 [Rhodoblastus acidophilus]|uniref:hypothetical protein n=1 Tax=Rhodoblastus acidophilus TaxID=1074 RepID=UPI0022252E7D|nr:hypothetical protein [Rhodoblastus acidophilus]MCW2285616.1 hypothetical protein [Rhodoblastus acidophilus]MCW2334626.1 hypothetical protein [Rhodoblastus acidophilus]